MLEENVIKLFNTLAKGGESGVNAALRLCRELVFFQRDPREREKIARRKDDPFDWSVTLEPILRVEDWEYAQLLDRGVRPLARAAALPTATLLIDAVTQMIALQTGRNPDAVETNRNDVSEIWCPLLDASAHPYPNPKADLIRTLTFACEQVYGERDKTNVQQVDEALRVGKWYVFDRIRYHLYAKHPTLAKEWIKEAILAYQGYGDEQYGFEFQKLLRVAVAQFDRSLLSEQEMTKIFEAIENGPDKEDYRQFMGERFSEEIYSLRQEYFQFRQFRPFAPVLFGKYAARYSALANKLPNITDDDFVRYSVGESKTGVSKSPKGASELATLTDDELISFLNDWEDARRDSEQWWVDIDFAGLATAFQQLLQADPNRFLNWGERWFDLKRPIYLRSALEVGAKRISDHPSELEQWFKIAGRIMSQHDTVPSDRPDETSRNQPGWHSSRRQVVDFVGVCIGKEVNVSLEWRSIIFGLLRSACVAPDYYLDADKAIMTPRDYLTDAINTTRGRALENLTQYGHWVRRNAKETDISDVFKVLEGRLDSGPRVTHPEHALLGAHLHQLYDLNSSWTKANVSRLFPRDERKTWSIGFATYLKFNRAHPLVFEMLKPHFEFGVENIRIFQEEKNPRNDSVAALGQHLLDYYVIGLIPLSGSDSLLEKYYRKTDVDHSAGLFDHLGRLLSKTAVLKPEVAARCKEFFEMRLSCAIPEELKEFTFWLKAECLEPRWRVEAFSRVLSVATSSRLASLEVADLAKLVLSEPDLVVTCFAKLTEGLMGKEYFYLRPEHVKPILKTGLSSKNEGTVETATRARDNLLKAGRTEYRNLDAIKDDPHWNE
jgi:hypothetical protein